MKSHWKSPANPLIIPFKSRVSKSVFKTMGALVTPSPIKPKTASSVVDKTRQGQRSTRHHGIPTRNFLKPSHTEPGCFTGSNGERNPIQPLVMIDIIIEDGHENSESSNLNRVITVYLLVN